MCQLCAAGRFTNATSGATECLDCPAAKYSPEAESWNCTWCEAGRYVKTTGNDDCLDCSVGTYSDKGALTCTNCPTGKAAEQEASTRCTACARGRYAASTGQRKCFGCPEGHFGNDTGSSTCTACAAGTFAGNTSMVACDDCTTGTYSGSTGATSCQACVAGYFINETGSSYCRACETGYYSEPGSKTCDVCDAGYIRHPRRDGGSCLECAGEFAGFDCTKRKQHLYTATLKKDYWRTAAESDDLRLCHNHACIGGNDTDAYCADGYKSYLCSVCQDGYFEWGEEDCYLCEVSTTNSAIAAGVLILGVAGVLYVLITNPNLDASCHVNVRLRGRLKILLSFGQIVFSLPVVFSMQYPDVFEEFLDKVVGTLSLDMLTGISWSDCVMPTTFYSSFILDTFVPGFASFALVLFILRAKWRERQARRFAESTLAGNVLQSTIAKMSARAQRRVTIARCTNLILFLLFVFLPQTSSTIFALYACDTFDDGKPRLRADYAVSCQGDMYLHYTMLGFLLILLYPCGVPLAYFILLYKKRKHLNPAYWQNRTESLWAAVLAAFDRYDRNQTGTLVLAEFCAMCRDLDLGYTQQDMVQAFAEIDLDDSGEIEAEELFTWWVNHDLSAKDFDQHVGGDTEDQNRHVYSEEEALEKRARDIKLQPFLFLFEMYRPSTWWWEVFETVRRLLLTGALTVFEPGSVFQLFVGMMICIGSLMMYSHFMPFIFADDNWMATAAQFEIYVVLVLGVLLNLQDADASSEDHHAVGVLLVTCTCLIFGAVIFIELLTGWQLLTEHWEECAEERDYQSEVAEAQMRRTMSSPKRKTASVGSHEEPEPFDRTSASRPRRTRPSMMSSQMRRSVFSGPAQPTPAQRSHVRFDVDTPDRSPNHRARFGSVSSMASETITDRTSDHSIRSSGDYTDRPRRSPGASRGKKKPSRTRRAGIVDTVTPQMTQNVRKRESALLAMNDRQNYKYEKYGCDALGEDGSVDVEIEDVYGNFELVPTTNPLAQVDLGGQLQEEPAAREKPRKRTRATWRMADEGEKRAAEQEKGWWPF